MPALNTTFHGLSNTVCTNGAFNAGTIGRMTEEVHETAARLYKAAKNLGTEGKSAVARLLNESPQVVNNWERRGVSEGGALKAQAVLGCNANYILTGEGEPMAGWPFKRIPLARVLALAPEDRAYVEGRLSQALDDLSTTPSPEDLKAFASAHLPHVKKPAKRKAA